MPNNTSSVDFPNGAWKGQPLTSTETSVPSWHSPFPWEQTLTSEQLSIANEVMAYDQTLHRSYILNCHKYLLWTRHGLERAPRSLLAVALPGRHDWRAFGPV